jgi:hypothetical protein
MRTPATLLAAFLWLAGCAGLSHVSQMSENQCRSIDWYQAGERDGPSRSPARIDTDSYQCDKHSVQVARDRYMGGWYEGNALYAHRTVGMEPS